MQAARSCAVQKKQTKVLTPEQEKKKHDLKYQRDRDRQLVRGKFIFHEVPGGSMSFVFRAYPQDEVEKFTLIDGQIYSIPLGVARHLNKNCWYPVHAYQMDDGGKPVMRIGQKVRRCSFQSLEFIDEVDMTPEGVGSVVTVEKIGTGV